MNTPRILFLLKLRHQYGDSYSTVLSSGLLNSATFVNDMLVKHGIQSKLVQVIDGNGVDREVHQYRPTIVILEALWVTPAKLIELRKLHPRVKWIVRLHSEAPFLANEGSSFMWINQYVMQENVFVSFNSDRIFFEIVDYFKAVDTTGTIAYEKLIYLPNYYPVTKEKNRHKKDHHWLDIACPGAVRPMKNHLLQAIAAVEYSRKTGQRLRFHINGSRVDNAECGVVLKNIRYFFASLPHDTYQLIEHDWLDREGFLGWLRTMDIVMQVSMSESFNICIADGVDCDVPVLTSHEVVWCPEFTKANPTSVNSIVRGLERVVHYEKWFKWLSVAKRHLERFSKKSTHIWLENIKGLTFEE